MHLKILPTRNNTYPKRGLLIKGNSPRRWLEVIQKCNLNLDNVNAFPIPSSKANELYGCFIYGNSLKFDSHLSNVIFFQYVQNQIFIPEYTTIHPQISKNETDRIFEVPHIFHPDFGWVTLKEPLNWLDCLDIKKPITVKTITPMLGTVIPKHIYKIAALAKDEKEIEKKLDLPLEKMSDSSLNTIDKLRLGLFKTLFKSKGKGPGQFDVEERGFLKLFNRLSGNKKGNSKWSKSMDALMTRNSREADRLLAMFAKNPQMAMRFAIPLDLIGSSRDSGKGLFSLFKGFDSRSDSGNSNGMSIFSIITRGVFIFMIIRLAVKASTTSTSSGQALGYILGILLIDIILYLVVSNLFKSGDGSGGTATIHDDRMEALRKQYEKLIEEEKKKGDYRKAAAMQIKLLGSHWLAAETLNEGEYYEEAAYLHLKYNKNKQSAAQCYADGRFYDKAIALYKELKEDEKVGDLYKESGSLNEANLYFKIVIDKYVQSHKYLDASQVYKEKIEDISNTQKTLLEGWRNRKESTKCIDQYFENIKDHKKLEQEILYFNKYETNISNIRIFIKSLKKQKHKSPELANLSKKLIYEIISKYHKSDPGIAFELSSFDDANKKIHRDSSIFVREEKKKKRK
ncbi:hypothetical protein [Nonlabens sp. Asnod3-A02]|uniref:hypothetical protein n=1 Tax=Nonlabens sp. Asnod3-A02 TaxID=3160579 RepID=UPI00386FA2BA